MFSEIGPKRLVTLDFGIRVKIEIFLSKNLYWYSLQNC